MVEDEFITRVDTIEASPLIADAFFPKPYVPRPVWQRARTEAPPISSRVFSITKCFLGAPSQELVALRDPKHGVLGHYVCHPRSMLAGLVGAISPIRSVLPQCACHPRTSLT